MSVGLECPNLGPAPALAQDGPDHDACFGAGVNLPVDGGPMASNGEPRQA